jgi:Flp pilus assembly protein TadG
MRRPVHGERGASAVEFAFILPLLILLVLGIAEFGHAFLVQGTLSAAAREGVRAMALRNDPNEARDVVQFAAASLNPGITDDQIHITVVGGTSDTCPITGAGHTAVRLTIDYDMPYLTGFFGSGIQLSGTGVMRCDG